MLEYIKNNLRISSDIGSEWGINLQDPLTVNMIGIKDLHDRLVFIGIFITLFVFYMLLINMGQKNKMKLISKDLNHSSTLEFIWTLIPTIILILIAVPSFKLLYSSEENINTLLTLKIIGNQWYWNYELFNVFGYNIDFSSYMNEDYKFFKYLETDNSIYLPILTPIKLLITASDVIHSWTVPSLGIKIDALPGRINYGFLYILRETLAYGQCSELCGLGHAYMPIELRSVDNLTFFNRVKNISS